MVLHIGLLVFCKHSLKIFLWCIVCTDVYFVHWNAVPFLAYRCDGVFNIAYFAYFLFFIQFSQILMYMYYTSIHNILEYFMNFPWWKKFPCFLAWIALNLHNLLFTIICSLLHNFFFSFSSVCISILILDF